MPKLIFSEKEVLFTYDPDSYELEAPTGGKYGLLTHGSNKKSLI